MTSTPRTDPGPDQPKVARRSLLTGGAAGLGLGAALGLGGGFVLGRSADGRASTSGGATASDDSSTGHGFGADALDCHGAHQAGIVTPAAAHVRYVAYRLRRETDRAAIARMFTVLSDDIVGLTSGDAPLADPEPELAARPARLSITVGVGPELVDRVDPGLRPDWLAPLPAFSRDRLGSGFDGGDLLLILQADDPLPLAHAGRMLDRDLASFAEPAWRQQGFTRASGAEVDGRSMRNLMGQVDGTVNPSPDSDDFASLVWLGADAGWLAGGSAFVLRRIRMELDTWDQVDRPGREQSVGRRLTDGSPLNAPEGSGEHAPADFTAVDERGLSAIPVAAHIRRAHSTDPNERIYRRAANYDDGVEAGLLFGCYQQDPLRQFVPIQARLDEVDLLNEWVTHTGSAVFAILPGFRPGETIGSTLLA